MKAKLMLIALCCWSVILASAQEFSSGSDGSYGPITVAEGETLTLDLPADGIFHATEVTIAGTLMFNRNSLNTPVYLLATGDLEVTASGEIGVSATNRLGGPGGFDGGIAGAALGPGILAGSGQGPGGGTRGPTLNEAGGGAYLQEAAGPTIGDKAQPYGTLLLMPLIGGSGGGGADAPAVYSGGGGGGAVLLSSDTKIVINGQIRARGDRVTTNINGGSGGAIRLVCPRVYGAGTLNVSSSGGSAGRIRVDRLLSSEPGDPSQSYALTSNPASAGTIGANLAVFPPGGQRLDVLEVSGSAIEEGTDMGVFLLLPFDSDPESTVVVQARNFNDEVPIRVALIPETGDSSFFDATIDNLSSNPASAAVEVTLPTGVRTAVQVWSR